MAVAARYVHTNLVAEDWRRLACFYQQVLGGIPVPPEHDFQGEKLEAGTGIPGAHLRLPGCGDNGPTLEIFNYNILEDRGKTAVNRPAFGHIAFSVEDRGGGPESGAGSGRARRVYSAMVSLSLRMTGKRYKSCP